MFRRFILLSGLVAICGSSQAVDSDGVYTALGYGMTSCEKFIDAVDKKNGLSDSESWTKYETYTTGYFTGVNILTSDTKNILGRNDLDGAMDFIENYCRENPMKSFAHSLGAVTDELYPGRKR